MPSLLQTLKLESLVEALGFRAWGLRLRVYGLGLRGQGLGFMV